MLLCIKITSRNVVYFQIHVLGSNYGLRKGKIKSEWVPVLI